MDDLPTSSAEWKFFIIGILGISIVLFHYLLGLNFLFSLTLGIAISIFLVFYLVYGLPGRARTIAMDEFQFILRNHPLKEGVYLSMQKQWQEGSQIVLYQNKVRARITLVHQDGSVIQIFEGTL